MYVGGSMRSCVVVVVVGCSREKLGKQKCRLIIHSDLTCSSAIASAAAIAAATAAAVEANHLAGRDKLLDRTDTHLNFRL